MTDSVSGPREGCDRVVEPGSGLAEAVASAAAGEIIGLRAGRHAANLMPARSVTLRALGEVVLDGGGRGPVLLVQGDGLEVTLQGLTLTGGSADVGGAVSLCGFSQVRLVDCTLRGNRSGQGPGGACHVDRGDLELLRCRITGCPGVGGVAVAVAGVGGLVLQDSLLVASVEAGRAALSVRDEGLVRLLGATVVATGGAGLSVAGSSSQRPEVRVVGCVVQGDPSLMLKALHPGRVSVGQTVLSTAVEGVYRPDGGVKVAAPLLGQGWRPSPVSPARGLYVSGGGLDLAGRERRPHGADAGALES